MKKVSLGLILMFWISICLLGCGGESGGEIPSADNLKFKASNVVFRNTVKASDEFTNQKVYADDVVLNNANTSLTADNVQGAFEETQPKLSEIIVGEWEIISYGDSKEYDIKQYAGTITFNADKTFSFVGEAGQQFIGISQLESLAKPVKYEIYNESLLGTTAETASLPYPISHIIDFTMLSTNKLISKCPNASSLQTVYVLTRKQ